MNKLKESQCINEEHGGSSSGRVLYLRSRGCGFEPHKRHCIVSMSKTLNPLLGTGSTQEDPSRHD